MSLLIKDVQVLDGEGSKPYKADVLVQKDKISAIGSLKSRGANKVIDGLGYYLTPGFIDTHTNSDHYLSIFDNPAQFDFTDQGVTTILGGHCGSSLAPLLYGTLESIRKWANTSEINVDWHTVEEFLDSLKSLPLGVNFGTLVGHSTVRRSLAGDRKRLQAGELEVFEKILKQSMSEGAFGLSTGLEYIHGGYASQKELKTLTEAVQKYNGVYATHIRSEAEDLLNSVKETIKLAEASGVKTVISHLRPFKKYEKQYEEALEEIAGTSAEIRFDIYPYSSSVRNIYMLLPDWSRVENFETMLERIRNQRTRKMIKKDLGRLDAKSIQIAGAPKHEYMVGKTLQDIASNLGSTAPEALLHVMDVTDLRAIVFIENVNPDLLQKALTHPNSFIASAGNAVTSTEFIKHEKSVDTFPKYIQSVMEMGSVELPEVIEKITSAPAEYFGIKDRGVIQEGKVADLVVLGKNDLQVKYTIVGGRISQEETARGKILEHSS